jgi:spoIIIJ-associated protein
MTETRANLEIIAPSVEEAIQQGLADLNLTEDKVEIEVLDEGSKGILGIGSRQARVRLVIKESKKPEIETDDSHSVQTESSEDEKEEGAEIQADEADDQILQIAKETVLELLEKMKVHAEVTATYGETEDDRDRPPVYVNIYGDDLSILIGRKAETLDALQYIAKLIIGKELERSVHLIVDVEGYRKRRETQIRQLASRVAEQVRETGRAQTLEPMPPHERRFVHIELRNNPNVYTASIGEGDRRKVVIHPEE